MIHCTSVYARRTCVHIVRNISSKVPSGIKGDITSHACNIEKPKSHWYEAVIYSIDMD